MNKVWHLWLELFETYSSFSYCTHILYIGCYGQVVRSLTATYWFYLENWLLGQNTRYTELWEQYENAAKYTDVSHHNEWIWVEAMSYDGYENSFKEVFSNQKAYSRCLECLNATSCLEHISNIIWGRNPKFGMWMHLGLVEFRIPFLALCDPCSR